MARTATTPQTIDLETEQAVLGAALDNRQDRERVLDRIVEDYLVPARHKVLLRALAALHARGVTPDDEALRLELGPDAWRSLGERGGLRELRGAAPLAGLPDLLLDRVVDCAQARKAVELLGEAQVAAAAVDLEHVEALLGGVGRALAGRQEVPVEIVDLADLMERPGVPPKPWVVPGLLRIGDRAVVTGGEGAGKMTLGRQFAAALAAAEHPLTGQTTGRRRSLLVDLQEDEDDLRDVLAQIWRAARNRYQRGLVGFACRPQGMNLLARRDVRWLETAIKRHQPDLVVLGPLWKTYRAPRGTSSWDEGVVEEVQAVLDELRTAHGFALYMEGHAGHDRETWRVRGSSAWYAWPDFGFGLQPELDAKQREVKLVRWRGDRYTGRPWPGRLVEGSRWPWEALPMQAARIKGYLERETAAELNADQTDLGLEEDPF